MIHCDEVFEILTRGPFPTGAASDGIVESHLSQCDECRRLAEALRPAVELLQEAITDDDGRDLPRYWGSLAEPQAARAGKALTTKTQTRGRRTSARRTAALPRETTTPAALWNGVARLAAAVLLGLVLASLLRQASRSHEEALGQMAGRAKCAHWRLNENGEQWFAAQGLAAACRQPVSGLTLVAAISESAIYADDSAKPPRSAEAVEPAGGGTTLTGAASRLACCLGCHSAKDQKRLATAAVSRLVQACGACHE